MRDSLAQLLADPSLTHLGAASILILAFAAVARRLRGVTRPGGIAGTLACLAIYLGAGPWGLLAVVVVFVLTWLATRYGYDRKRQMGTAEEREGRTALQVRANLGAGAVCAVVAAAGWKPAIFLAACAAALAEAAADTVSSEIGQASGGNPRLITTWKLVPIGTNGGVSLGGSLAGAAAALIVSLAFLPAAIFPSRWFFAPALAGFLGMLMDSVLGAWLERRSLLTNNSVNLLSTSIAALLSGCLAALVQPGTIAG